MRIILRWLAVLLLGAGFGAAHAAITCTQLAASDYTGSYVAGTTTATQSSVTLTCHRNVWYDPTSMAYTISADNGDHSSGNQNNAQVSYFGYDFNLGYDLYLTNCNGLQFYNNNTLSGTMTFATGSYAPVTVTRNFWTCIKTAQNPFVPGSYTDSVTLSARYYTGSGYTTITDQHDVTIYAPASCVIATAPSNVALTYPAFSASDITGSTTFAARCTLNMPYSLSVAPASGTLAGVNYNVTLSSSNATGTSLNQTHTITVTAPAGQAGTCTGAVCTQTQTHTLTLTY